MSVRNLNPLIGDLVALIGASACLALLFVLGTWFLPFETFLMVLLGIVIAWRLALDNSTTGRLAVISAATLLAFLFALWFRWSIAPVLGLIGALAALPVCFAIILRQLSNASFRWTTQRPFYANLLEWSQRRGPDEIRRLLSSNTKTVELACIIAHSFGFAVIPPLAVFSIVPFFFSVVEISPWTHPEIYYGVAFGAVFALHTGVLFAKSFLEVAASFEPESTVAQKA